MGSRRCECRASAISAAPSAASARSESTRSASARSATWRGRGSVLKVKSLESRVQGLGFEDKGLGV